MQQPSTEQDLIVQAQGGSEEAISLLYEMHVNAIFEFLSYRVDTTYTAEDLTSEVFIRMVRGLANYTDRGVPFRAWLYRIATNLVTDHFRQNKKRDALPLLDDYPGDDTNPFDEVAKREEHARLRIALRALPEAYQNLLIMRFVDNLSHTEIATILDKSADALRSMQHRALNALGEKLAEFDQRDGAQEEEDQS
jgi:RNA polymerase sigma-70 factor (ECF subfamily)